MEVILDDQIRECFDNEFSVVLREVYHSFMRPVNLTDSPFVGVHIPTESSRETELNERSLAIGAGYTCDVG
jgi:hypothetical protein